MTNGFPDKDKTELGVGYFRFQTVNGEKEVYINDKNNTLEGAARAINGAGVGVKANVLNDRSNPDAPFKLVITGDAVGDDHKISYPTLYFLDGDQDIFFEKQREAKNGKLKVDGFEFEVGDNTVKDAIPGVTLDLKQATPGRTINIGVKEDKEIVGGKVKGFVDAVNGVLTFVQTQNALNKESDTTSTLGGDGLLRTVENRLRSLVQNSQPGVGGAYTRLSQVGISFKRDGLLELDQKKFDDALARDPGSVQKFMAGDGFSTGFISSLKREVSSVLNTAFGPIAIRKKALQDRIAQANESIANKERQLAKKEESLRDKFSRLEETMGRLKGQAGQLAAIPGGGGGG